MKKLFLGIVILALLFCLCACSTHPENGKYVCEIGSVTFSVITLKSGKIHVQYQSGRESEGSYELNNGKIIATYTNGNGDTFDYDAENCELELAGTLVWKKE